MATFSANDFAAACAAACTRALLGAGVPDLAAPVISGVDPPAGTRVPREQSIRLDVTDDSGLFRRALLTARFPEARMHEVVHDGTSFTYHYTTHSTRSVITNGFRYDIRRDTGWPGAIELVGYFIDLAGNENA